MDRITTAEVHLDEVVAQLLEEIVGILLVVLIETGTLARGVAIVVTAAGVIARIAIDACLQALAVDMIHDRFQAIGEALFIDEQLACRGVTTALKAIIGVDILITSLLKPVRHGVGLLLDERLRDVTIVGVP